MRRAAVAVIGGGVMGASVAYHLAARGQRDVLVLDRAEAAGAGSTGRATGGYRAQYGTAINVRLSLLARAKLRSFRDETGVDPGYLPAGYLWLGDEPKPSCAASRPAAECSTPRGSTRPPRSRRRTSRRLNPAIRLDGIVGGAFCPSDGFIRPLGILDGYLTAARPARRAGGVGRAGHRAPADGRRPDRPGRDLARPRRGRRGRERRGRVGRGRGRHGRRRQLP